MSFLCQFDDKKSLVTWIFLKNAWVPASTICSYRGSISAISQTFDYTKTTIKTIGGTFVFGSANSDSIQSIATSGGSMAGGAAIDSHILYQL